jgi:hypothetical protein
MTAPRGTTAPATLQATVDRGQADAAATHRGGAFGLQSGRVQDRSEAWAG